jgi:hypothetical protein
LRRTVSDAEEARSFSAFAEFEGVDRNSHVNPMSRREAREAVSRRQEAGGKRQEARGKRQEARGKRQETRKATDESRKARGKRNRSG